MNWQNYPRDWMRDRTIEKGIRVAITVSVILGATFTCERETRRGQNPSPMVERTRRHERLSEDTVPGLSRPLSARLRAKVDVYVPPSVVDEGPFDLLIHFHGSAFVTRHAAHSAPSPLVAVNVHLGAGSTANESPFLDTLAFSELLQDVMAELDTLGIRSSPQTRIYLSAFSAGYGAIRAILPHYADTIAGVLLLDGLHTDYVPERAVLHEGGGLNVEKLYPFLRFAERAVAGEKSFLITHSEIFPGTFASTTETTDFLVEALGLARTPVLEWGPGGMQLLSRVSKGGLNILGFAGNTAPDHVDHLHGMPVFIEMMTIQKGERGSRKSDLP